MARCWLNKSQGCYAISTYDRTTTPGAPFFIHYLVVPDPLRGGFKIEECAGNTCFENKTYFSVDTNNYPSLSAVINQSPIFTNFEPAGKFQQM